jgi:xylose dehydrogenase (NAD/NADP)
MSTATRLRWGILGAARIARREVIPSIIKSSNGSLQAIGSRDLAKAKELQSEFGFRSAYGSYEEVLADSDVDALYIPLPNNQHCEWVLKAAAAGKHILCEKPIGLNAAEARRMVDACKAADVRLMEAFMYRYSDRTAKVRELIQTGALGEIRQINSTFRFLLANPESIKLQPKLGGGSLFDVGCYPVNFVGMVADLVGAGPASARPLSSKVDFIESGGVDLQFSALLRYPSGLMASIHSGFNAHKRVYSEVIGTSGVLEIPDTFFGNPGTMVLSRESGDTVIDVEASERYVLEVEDFARAVFEGRDPFFPLSETLRNMELIDALYEQTGLPNRG